MKIWGKYTSLVYWRYWVELPFMCKSIVEAWNWKCSHNKWTSQLNVGDFKNINDVLVYRNISWLFPKKEILSFIFLDLLSGALADLLHLILPIIPFIWLTRSHALLLWNKSLMKYILLHKIFMDLFGLVFWPQVISPCSLLVQWSIQRSLVPIVFVLTHCFSPRPANTSQSMLQNRCQYFFCSTCIFYLLLFPEKFRSTYISWFELHIENDGFHDYHALLSNLRSLSIRIRLRSLQGNKHGVNSVSCVAWSPT